MLKTYWRTEVKSVLPAQAASELSARGWPVVPLNARSWSKTGGLGEVRWDSRRDSRHWSLDESAVLYEMVAAIADLAIPPSWMKRPSVMSRCLMEVLLPRWKILATLFFRREAFQEGWPKKFSRWPGSDPKAPRRAMYSSKAD